MAIHPVPFVNLVLGVALLATIGFAATRSPLARQSPARRLLGWLLVVVPLPSVVAFRLFLPWHPAGGEVAFGVGIAAFAVGAVLVLARNDEEDRDSEIDLGPAPWWPEFEREFRAYTRRQSRPRVPV
jgi:hypothetical protein